MKRTGWSEWAIKGCIGVFLPVLAGGAAAPAGAADRTGATRFSSEQIQEALDAPVRGTASATLPTGSDGPRIMVVRRTADGEPEVHDQFDDIFVVRSGHARVTVGGTVSGSRVTGPGENRGGTISGGEVIKISAGDVLWIPAGKPHQVMLLEGGEVSYVVVKRPKLGHPAP